MGTDIKGEYIYILSETNIHKVIAWDYHRQPLIEIFDILRGITNLNYKIEKVYKADKSAYEFIDKIYGVLNDATKD